MNPEYPFQPGQQPSQGPAPAGQGSYAFPGAQQPAQQPLQQPYPQPGYGQVPQPGYTPVPPTNLPPVHHTSGAKKWVILTFVFLFTTLASGGVAVWSYMNYMDQKENVDSKVAIAVAEAVKEQADKDAADFLEKEKQPNRQFVGPDDYGRLSFDYPKTWSVYVASEANQSGDDYEAYFNPGVVPVIDDKQQFALHVKIENEDYDKVLGEYQRLVDEGSLKASTIKADEQGGTRLDGKFTEDIRGSAVIFKIRDKTVTIRTEAETFTPDFNALIQTITFNK